MRSVLVATAGCTDKCVWWRCSRWSYRSSRLIREIVAWKPHVICLQEVDHYDDFFEPELRKVGAHTVLSHASYT